MNEKREKRHDIETQIALLTRELEITRQEMKKYNDLRKTMNEVIERVIKLEIQQIEEEKRGKATSNVTKNTRDWILFTIAIAGWLMSLIQFLK
ncbi:MAG TPA: hypothetical protein GX514_09155 [Thermoanaerobacterales bacterium]|nr:hypothetical protein [Thermoanaerobacterales bacterium]